MNPTDNPLTNYLARKALDDRLDHLGGPVALTHLACRFACLFWETGWSCVWECTDDCLHFHLRRAGRHLSTAVSLLTLTETRIPLKVLALQLWKQAEWELGHAIAQEVFAE